MFNNDIREKLKKNSLKLWQVAELIKINYLKFSKELRKKLTSDEKDRTRLFTKSL